MNDRTIIDIHAIQTVPPSNLNRDDTGSPKTAVYGGVTRARVSSQAWKRAIRLDFSNHLDDHDLGRRTKEVVDGLVARIRALAPELATDSVKLAIDAFKAAGIDIETKKPKKGAEEGAEPTHGSKYLLFLSNRQYENAARIVVDAARKNEKVDKKALKAALDTDHSVDIALFGRMVADLADINVDAACQVAHAISVHAVANEFDYYTAVDDAKHDADETGAGMIGTVEFNSSTLYRYATLDADRLRENLGDGAATARAVAAFIRSFVTSMPSGKQNTFANRTVPDAIVVHLRETQPINYAAAFEVPIRAEDKASRIAGAASALATYARDVHAVYDDLAPVRTWTLHVGDTGAAVAELGDTVTLTELVRSIEDAVMARAAGS